MRCVKIDFSWVECPPYPFLKEHLSCLQDDLNQLTTIHFTFSNSRSDLVVADLGCGEGKLAQNVEQKVHSFDLVANNECVTACDMAKVSILRCDAFCIVSSGTE